MIVTYWGVRGSIPVPGPHTVAFGGNSACVSVEIENRVLVIDAGTGIRALGNVLLAGDKEIYLLISHPHADHVIGFPFFAPLYEPGRKLYLLDHLTGSGAWSLLELFDGRRFPRPSDLSAAVTRIQGDVLEFLREHGFGISRLALNHPGGAYGYRIESGGRSFVHLTDHELHPPGPPTTSFADVVRFCRGAEVLSHDAQYLRREMEGFRGRGHSSVEQVCALAAESDVGQLVLFHHDPSRTDDDLRAIEAEARAALGGTGIPCTAAYEGLVLDLRPAPGRSGVPVPGIHRSPAPDTERAPLTLGQEAAAPAAVVHPAGPAG